MAVVCWQVFTVLYDAASKYPEWKSANNPDFMPWRHPEQNTVKLVRIMLTYVRTVM